MTQRPESQRFVLCTLRICLSGNGDALLLTVYLSISPVSHAPPSRQAKCHGFKPRLFDSYNPQLSNDVPNNTIVIASRDVLVLNIRTTDPQQDKKASKESPDSAKEPKDCTKTSEFDCTYYVPP